MKLRYVLAFAAAACSGPCVNSAAPGFHLWRKKRPSSVTSGKTRANAHLDIKRLGKIDGVGHKKAGTRQVRRRHPGWEYLHVCVDDASRAAYTAVLPDETAESAIEFLWFAVAWYSAHGIKVERVLTDNGACYKSQKFRDACREFGIKHKRTRPYRPQTNGKAERFIRTALKEWAYAHTYTHSEKRTANLPVWTHRYNFVRPHTALGRKPPSLKAERRVNNVLTLYT